MNIKKWTTEETEQLKRLWLDGFTGGEIARVLERGRKSVMGKLHRENMLAQCDKHPIIKKNTRVNKKRHKRSEVAKTLYGNRGKGKPFVDIKRGECQFPVGEGVDMKICAAKCQEGASYCKLHHALTHQPRIHS